MPDGIPIEAERRLRLESAYSALLAAAACHPRDSREADILSAMLDEFEVELVDRDDLMAPVYG